MSRTNSSDVESGQVLLPLEHVDVEQVIKLMNEICLGNASAVEMALFETTGMDLRKQRTSDKSTVLHCLVFSHWQYTEKDSAKLLHLILNYESGKYKSYLLTARDINGETPLHLATKYNRFGLANQLIVKMKLGPDYLVGTSPLHLLSNAKAKASVKTMKLLLAPKFDTDDSKAAFERNLDDVLWECAKISAMHGAQSLLLYFLEEKHVPVKRHEDSLLQYAATGFDSSSRDCLRMLLTHKMIITPHQHYAYFNDKSEFGGFAILKLACEQKNSDTVSVMLPRVERSAQRSLHWLDLDGLKLVYTYVPIVLLRHLDSSLAQRPASTPPKIRVNFRPIVSSESSEVAPHFLQSAALACLMENPKGHDIEHCILLHSTIQLYVQEKWKRLKWPLVIWTCLQFALTGSFNTLIVQKILFSDKNFAIENTSHTEFVTDAHSNNHPETFYVVPAALVLIVGMLVLLKELFQMRHPRIYFGQIRNWAQLYVVICAIFLSIFVLFLQYPLSWGKEVHFVWIFGIASLCSCTLLTVDLGRIWGYEKYLELLIEVSKTSVKILVFYAPLLTGFAILFMAQTRQAMSFEELPRSFVRILAMTVGDLDYNGLDEKVERGSDWALVLFLLSVSCFIIVMGIALINVLIGLAVFDLEVLLKNAECRQIGARILLVAECEEFINAIYKALMCNCVADVQWVKDLKDWMTKEFIIQEMFETTLDDFPVSVRQDVVDLLNKSYSKWNRHKSVKTKKEEDKPKLPKVKKGIGKNKSTQTETSYSD